MRYRRLSFELPREAEEPLTAALWALGTLGLELDDAGPDRLRIDAWFDEPEPAAVRARAGEWRADGVEVVASKLIDEADWLAAYRRQARPIRIGQRIVVDPRDRPGSEPLAAGERRLHLPARRAFGTGSHASTRLAVELLEEVPLAGRVLLDLGTGSGVLAFVALAAGARRVVALDNDPVAALIAGQNRAANRLWPAVAAGTIDCLRAGPRFDAVVVNILPHLVAGDLPALVERLRPGAAVVVSGLLESDRAAHEARLAGLGLATRARRREGDWAGLRARYEP